MSEMNNTPQPQVNEPGKELTPQEKFNQTLLQNLARQRENALNGCAELETRLQLALAENEELKKKIAAFEADQASDKATKTDKVLMTKPERVKETT